MPEREYLERKRATVVDALTGHGIETPVDPPIAVPPRTRRRAVFKVKKTKDAVVVGFHAASSHVIVDMHECLVLTRGLFELVGGLRAMMEAVLSEGEAAELHVTEADNGFDVGVRWRRQPGPALVQVLAPWASKLNLVRITAGREILVTLEAPLVRLGRAQVPLPVDSFLQPTREGERTLQTKVLGIAGRARRVADLFSGCGTFSIPLAERAGVHAVERDADMLGALTSGARSAPGLKAITSERRDLFRNPLRRSELERYDAVVLDPPRAGAERQADELAASHVPAIAYVSCDAHSFARDARILIDGGLRLVSVTPVDQFLWSEHIELVGAFERRRRG